MIPPPLALNLTLCERLLIEEGTRNITLVGTFRRLAADGFPYEAHPFSVFVILTGGQGDADLTLTVTNLETDEVIYSQRNRIRFADRFTEARIHYPLAEITFAEAGEYMFTLTVDDDWVAHRRLLVQ